MPMHPNHEPDERAILASAFADGVLGEDQRARLAEGPELQSHANAVARLRQQLLDVGEVAAVDRDRTIAAALAADRSVVPIGHRRRWAAPVLAAAAALVALGVVGVTVLGDRTSDDPSATRTAEPSSVADAEMASVEASGAGADSGGSDTSAADATIDAIDAPATAAIFVDGPTSLAALPDPAEKEVAVSAGSFSAAIECLTDGQTFVADILYQGVPAIAVRTLDGTTLAIDEQCQVLVEVGP